MENKAGIIQHISIYSLFIDAENILHAQFKQDNMKIVTFGQYHLGGIKYDYEQE